MPQNQRRHILVFCTQDVEKRKKHRKNQLEENINGFGFCTRKKRKESHLPPLEDLFVFFWLPSFGFV